MRTLSIVTLSLMAAACASESELRYTSTLTAETNGVALSADGLDSYAAMSGTTCQIDTSWGCPTSDADLPTDQERVVDHFDGLTLGATDEGVHTIENQNWLPEFDMAMNDVRNARITNAGVLVVAGDANSCSLSTEEGSIELPAALCGDHAVTDVDRDGALYTAAEGGVYRADRDGVELLLEGADLVAFDSGSGLFIHASQGDNVLSAVNRSGDTVWTETTVGAIESVAVRGDKGEFLVLLDDGEFGSVARFDAQNGELEETYNVPNPDGTLVVSGNGRTVGIVGDLEVNYYVVEVDGEDPVIDMNVESCMDSWNWNTPTTGD